jgi:hypothetical protein
MEDASKKLRRLERRTNKKLRELSGPVSSDDGIRRFKTVADLEEAKGNADEVVLLLGYYSVGDFGQPLQLICGDEDLDSIKSYQFSNGVYANLYNEGPINVLWFGAKNDNTDPDTTTAAIQEAINEAGGYFFENREEWTNARTVFFPRGEYQTNATIFVETGVTLVGETPHPGGVKVWDQANHGTKIRPKCKSDGTNGSYCFRLRSNVTIQSMVIQHFDTEFGTQNELYADGFSNDTAFNYIKSWDNNGIAIGSSSSDIHNDSYGHAYGCCIRDCIIAGFQYAVLFYHFDKGGGRYRLENLLIDCWNGVNIIGTGDICRLRDVHLWPLLESYGPSNQWRMTERGGTGIRIERGGDWAQLSGCFVFGYQVGFELKDANLTTMFQCSFDGSETGQTSGISSQERIRTNPVYGLKVLGASTNTTVTGFQSGGHPVDGHIPVYLDIDGAAADAVENIILSDCMFGAYQDQTKVYIDNAKYVSINNSFLPAGDSTFTINPQSNVKLRVNNCLIPSSPGEYLVKWSQTVGQGDSPVVKIHNTLIEGSPPNENEPTVFITID